MFPVYKLSRENTQLENMCDITFEKVQGCAKKVNRMSVYAEAAVQRVHWTIFYEKISQNSRKTSMPESLF